MQNGGNGILPNCLQSKRGSCSSGGVWCTAKRDSMGYCSSTVDLLQPPPATVHPRSTSSSLHRLMFIHHRLPLASIGYCSSSLHGVLFIHPQPAGVWRPPRGPVHPAPTTFTRQGYCSSTANPLAGAGRTSRRQQWELFIHSQPTA
jgi:hypothetical protein